MYFFVFQIGMQPEKVDRVKRKHQKDNSPSKYEFSTNPQISGSSTISSLESDVTLSYCAVSSTSIAITSSTSAINSALVAITSSVSAIDSASVDFTSPSCAKTYSLTAITSSASGNSLLDPDQNSLIDYTINSNTTSPPNNDGITEGELSSDDKRSSPCEESDGPITSKANRSFEDISFTFEEVNSQFQDTLRPQISQYDFQVSTQTSCK